METYRVLFLAIMVRVISMIMLFVFLVNEPPRDKNNKMTVRPAKTQISLASSEDSDQPGHLPSLIRVFAVC